MSVKKLLSCILAILMISIFVLPCFAANPVLSVSVSDSKVNIGDIITVTANLSPESSLANFDFTVNFKTTEFEYFAGSSSVNDSGVFENAAFNSSFAPGAVQFTGNSTVGTAKGGVLISVKMKVIKAGGTISLAVNNATDAEGNPVTVKTTSVKLNCAHENIVWKETTPATCAAEGIETGNCVCGAYSTTRKTEKIAHVFEESKVKKEPTCTETGIQVGICTVCKSNGTEESVIPAKGHDYAEWVVKTEPTEDTIGAKERICRTCGDIQTQMMAYDEEENSESSTDEGVSDDLTNEFESDTPIFETEENLEPETEPNTKEPKDLFGVLTSQRMVIVVLALAGFVAIALIVYMILLVRQKKK